MIDGAATYLHYTSNCQVILKEIRSNKTKSCENDVCGVVLQQEWWRVFCKVNTYVFFSLCFQVPDSGNYSFYASCDDWCELWKYDIDEDGIENRDKKSEKSLTKQPIIALYAYTGYLQWNK